MVVRMYHCDQAARSSFRRSKIELFGNLEDYIEAYSEFSDLVLDNFRFIFLYYFLLCSLAFAVFCVHLVRSAKLFLRLIVVLKRSQTRSQED